MNESCAASTASGAADAALAGLRRTPMAAEAGEDGRLFDDRLFDECPGVATLLEAVEETRVQGAAELLRWGGASPDSLRMVEASGRAADAEEAEEDALTLQGLEAQVWLLAQTRPVVQPQPQS